MKRKSLTKMIAALVGSCIMFTSCIGSFGLTNKLLDWNNNVDSKFVNELVFLAFWIVPVYEISVLADVLVINSIEFWSGSNPVAETSVKTIETPDGNYTVETNANGYKIQKDGEAPVDLVFNENDQTWNVEAKGEVYKLMKMTKDNEVVMYLPNGEEMNVELNKGGIMEFRQAANNFAFVAAR